MAPEERLWGTVRPGAASANVPSGSSAFDGGRLVGLDWDPRSLLAVRPSHPDLRLVRRTEPETMDEVLAMIIIGKLPDEVSETELAELHG
jgi:hypothetical protein